MSNDRDRAKRGTSMADFQDDLVALLPQLRAFARALTGGDAAFADDLVQDTVVKGLQARSSFAEGTNLKAWLFTILRNNLRSVMRSKRVKSEVSDEGLENFLWRPPAQEDRLEFEAFRRAFRLLSPAHREVLILVGVHGYPYDKAAEIAGCEVGTVRSRLNRARTQLKRMLLEGELPLPEPKARAEVEPLPDEPGAEFPIWMEDEPARQRAASPPRHLN
jgi:RNA polymerase sigma-70 factor (ECF subfamily)